YSIIDKQIVIYESDKSNKTISDINSETAVKQQNQKTITGKVSDINGESIIGANIIEEGTTNGTVTDIDGNFSISISNNATIRITYIGYVDQIINTSGRTSFNIILEEDKKILEELIVI